MSKIEWTEKTVNVVTGCTKYSEGCQNCYAEKMTRRLAAMGQKKYAGGFNQVIFHSDLVAHEFDKLGKIPKMVFINSMSDTFHKNVKDDEIKTILSRCQYNSCCEPVPHTFQILTKRADRLPNFEYPQNVWLGITVEHADYKHRIDDLRKTDAKVKFLSCEPLLGDLGELNLSGIDWVICGGESGHNARPCHPDWVRNIQRQCTEQNVPFFFKQWGEWCQASQLDYDAVAEKFNIVNGLILNVPIDDKTKTYNIGKKMAGCLLDGKEYKEYPRS